MSNSAVLAYKVKAITFHPTSDELSVESIQLYLFWRFTCEIGIDLVLVSANGYSDPIDWCVVLANQRRYDILRQWRKFARKNDIFDCRLDWDSDCFDLAVVVHQKADLHPKIENRQMPLKYIIVIMSQLSPIQAAYCRS